MPPARKVLPPPSHPISRGSFRRRYPPYWSDSRPRRLPPIPAHLPGERRLLPFPWPSLTIPATCHFNLFLIAVSRIIKTSMTRMKIARVLAGGVLVLAAGWRAVHSQAPASPIRFAYQPIDFTLDSCETPQRHAPETMAGGVAVFDYNNDGALDIFFTNGADIGSLKKTAPKYSNRL